MGERGSYAPKQAAIISIQSILPGIAFTYFSSRFIKVKKQLHNRLALNKFQKYANCLKWVTDDFGWKLISLGMQRSLMKRSYVICNSKATAKMAGYRYRVRTRVIYNGMNFYNEKNLGRQIKWFQHIDD